MRAGINNMQSCFYAFGNVSEQNVYAIVDQPNPKEVDEVLSTIWDEDFTKSLDKLQEMSRNGTNILDILNNLQRNLERNSNFNQKNLENLKLILYKELTYSKMVVMEGNDSFLQLASCVGKLITYIAGFKKNFNNFESMKKV